MKDECKKEIRSAIGKEKLETYEKAHERAKQRYADVASSMQHTTESLKLVSQMRRQILAESKQLIGRLGIAPMKIKHVVILLIILDFVLYLQPIKTGISHITHLGGLLVAFLYLKGPDIYRRLRHGRPRYYRIDEDRRRPFLDDYPRH